MITTIRPIAPTDRAEWLRMRLALWPGEADAHKPDIDLFFAGENALLEQIWVAEEGDGENLVGFIELALRPYAEGCEASPVPFIEGWYVDEAHRQRGVGAQLVAAAEHWAREAGYQEMGSDTESFNALSITAHQALGFEVVEEITCFRKAL